VLREALTAIGEVRDEWNVARELDLLLPALPNTVLGAAMNLVLMHAPGETVEPLTRLAPRWRAACHSAEVSEGEALSAILDAFATEGRARLLAALTALLPALHTQGGDAVLNEARLAIVDTAKWWP
jgi:hypothetical protein